MALSLVAFFVVVAGVNWLADPYGAWGIALIDRVYLRTNQDERVVTPYHLRTEQPTTMLVGSSRVLWGMPVEQGYRDGFFNASLPGASLDEIAGLVRVALRNPHLKRLVWGVDFFCFEENWSGRDPLMRLRLEDTFGLRVTETLLSTDALTASGKLLVRAAVGRIRLAATEAAPLPWPQAIVAAALDDAQQARVAEPNDRNSERQLDREVFRYSGYRLSADGLARFRASVAAVRGAGVDVIVFIGPMNVYEIEAIHQGGSWDAFREWKRQLATIQPYWDFSGYNDLAYADHLFTDPMHYRAGVGQLILRRLLGEDTSKCGETAQLILDSGVWVDAATVDQHLARQEVARLAPRNSPYQALGADLLRY